MFNYSDRRFTAAVADEKIISKDKPTALADEAAQ